MLDMRSVKAPWKTLRRTFGMEKSPTEETEYKYAGSTLPVVTSDKYKLNDSPFSSGGFFQVYLAKVGRSRLLSSILRVP